MAHHDEPFADPSLLPTRLLSRLAREQVTVALSGDGGDELFGGYARHLSADRLLKHPAWQYGPLARTLFGKSILMTPHRLRPLAQRVLGMDAGLPTRFSGGELGVLARAIHDPALVHRYLAHGDTRGETAGPELAAGLMNGWLEENDFLSPAERQQYMDTAGYLPDNILTKVDRASMAVSLEVRVPILDHRIVEFSYRLPPAMKAGALGAKRILKGVLGGHVPHNLFERPKQGFAGPVRFWLKGPLREWAADLISKEVVSRLAVEDPVTTRSALLRLRTGKVRVRDFRLIALAAWSEAHL